MTVQVNETEPEYPAPSVAVAVTESVPAVVGVPVTAPVDGSMDSPAGRPVADQVRVAVEDESAAGTSTVVMADPDGSDWSPGLVTVTALVTVQVNETEPEYPAPSVAVAVTESVPAVVGVPVTAPVDGSMDSPAGRPVADQVRVAVEDESEAPLLARVSAVPDTDDWSGTGSAVTVSALLQAMQVDIMSPSPGRAMTCRRPFHVLATQNPLEQEGAYPLPEAQLDRFLLQIDVGYPDRAVGTPNPDRDDRRA